MRISWHPRSKECSEGSSPGDSTPRCVFSGLWLTDTARIYALRFCVLDRSNAPLSGDPRHLQCISSRFRLARTTRATESPFSLVAQLRDAIGRGTDTEEPSLADDVVSDQVPSLGGAVTSHALPAHSVDDSVSGAAVPAKSVEGRRAPSIDEAHGPAVSQGPREETSSVGVWAESEGDEAVESKAAHGQLRCVGRRWYQYKGAGLTCGCHGHASSHGWLKAVLTIRKMRWLAATAAPTSGRSSNWISRRSRPSRTGTAEARRCTRWPGSLC